MSTNLSCRYGTATEG